MPLQELLVTMVRDSCAIERVDADHFIVTPHGAPSIRLCAPEEALARYAQTHATDGLLALGAVGDDATGTTAAIALLSVHIEEAIACVADGAVTRLVVGKDGLSVTTPRGGAATRPR